MRAWPLHVRSSVVVFVGANLVRGCCCKCRTLCYLPSPFPPCARPFPATGTLRPICADHEVGLSSDILALRVWRWGKKKNDDVLGCNPVNERCDCNRRMNPRILASIQNLTREREQCDAAHTRPSGPGGWPCRDDDCSSAICWRWSRTDDRGELSVSIRPPHAATCHTCRDRVGHTSQR